MNRFVGLFLIFCLFISGCAFLGYVKDPFEPIPVFNQVTPTLYRGSYPKNPAGYEKLKDLGIKTIINLSNDTKYVQAEQKICQTYGFDFIHIPLSVYQEPTDQQAQQFLTTVLTKNNQPVFVHCTNGRDRTGTMIAVYRVFVEHKGPKQGYKEALKYGFWPYRGEVVLKKYIHQLKDHKQLYDFVTDYQKETP